VGLPGIVLVAISISLGAIVYWAFTFRCKGFCVTAVTAWLIGVAGMFVPAIVFSTSRSSEKTQHTLYRQVSDLNGGCRSTRQRINQLTQGVLSSAITRPSRQILPARGTSDHRSESDNARRY